MGFSNLAIRTQLYVMAVFFVVCIVTVSLIGYRYLQITNDNFSSVYNSRVKPLDELKFVADKFAVDIVDTTHKYRNRNLSSEQALRNVDDALRAIDQKWGQYFSGVTDLEEKNIANQTQELIQNVKAKSVSRLLQIIRSGDQEALVSYVTNELYPAIDPISEHISNLISFQLHRASESYQQSQNDFGTAKAFSFLVLLVAIAMGFGVSLLIMGAIKRPLNVAVELMQSIAGGNLNNQIEANTGNEIGLLLAATKKMQEQLRQMIERINDSAAQVASSAEQLAIASGQVTSGSQQQGQATSIVAAAMEELAVSIEQVALGAGDAERKANDSGILSEQGAMQVQDAADEMARIAESVQQAVRQITALGDQAQQIDSIVDVIRGVAEQTNLLALNAAIEAARAGEQGRGFAVVADEVRSLAGRTSTSALEITSMVSSIQNLTAQAVNGMTRSNEQASQGVVLARRAGESMSQIRGSSVGVMQSVSGISTALKEQKIAGSEIARNVEHIAQMTDQNGGSVAEVAKAAMNLKTLATELKNSVNRFRVH